MVIRIMVIRITGISQKRKKTVGWQRLPRQLGVKQRI